MSYMNADLNRNYTALKNELLQQGIVTEVTLATSPATDIYWHSDVESWPGKNAGETIEMGTIITREDYFKTMGMKIVAGRDFTGINDTLSVIFNETAMQQMRIKDPVGQSINWQGTQYTIAGVVKDALMVSPFAPAEPTMFFIDGNNKNNLMYRLSPNISTSEALDRLTTIFNKYNPAFPYSYQFADESYGDKFNLEILIGKLAGLFAALAIFISCLGLFGLAAYIAEQRVKEIGIRKVLGASTSQIWMLLSKDFIILVLVSCVIATPLAFYYLQEWLQTYEYRITIGPSVFFIAAAIALVITLVTISFQAVRAALANPVKSLRTQ
jgi:putative ABC transport system permease protein